MKNLHLLLMLAVDVLTQTRGLDKRAANNFLSRHRRKSNRRGEKLKIAPLRIVKARIHNAFDLIFQNRNRSRVS